MRLRFVHLARLLVLALWAVVPASPAKPQSLPADGTQVVRLPVEVRLRKLHLVRPDLISYPIFFEVYC